MFLKNSRPIVSYSLGSTRNFAAQCPTLWDGTKCSSFASAYSNGLSTNASIKNAMENIAVGTKIGANRAENDGSTYGVLFGTGNTVATSDDYKLSGDVITGLSSANVTYTSEAVYDDNGVTLTTVYTISNTTGADLTIGEVGLVANFSTKVGQVYAAKFYTLLYERTALDSPVTIPADGVGQVTYTICMNYPV